MADLSKLRFNGTDYNVKDASAPLRKFTNYSKTGNLPITSDDTTQTAIGKLEKALDDKINTSAKGTSNGVAELDANGKVPSSQLPSYVDDVLEYSAKSSFPATGETGKIYVDTTTNKTYRWSGSAYVEISESLALGETSSTACRGDRGKAAYDHSQVTSGNPHGTTGANTKLTGYSKGSSKDAVAATDTVNAAIAKHENRIDANQSNILSVANRTGKNRLPFLGLDALKSINTAGSWSNNAYTSNNVTFTVNTDGTISVSGTLASGEIRALFYCFTYESNITLKDLGVGNVLSGCPSGGGNQSYGLMLEMAKNPYSMIAYDFSNHPSIIMPSTATDDSKVVCYIVVSTHTTVNVVFEPMVSEPDMYALDPSYVPFALPNYDLTRLEAEDRASLAEVVDSGAKNLLNISNATFGDRSKVTFNSDGSVTGAITDDTRYWSWANSEFKFTLPAGRYVLYCVVTSGTNTNWGIALRKSDNSEVAVVNSYVEKGLVEFTLTSATEVGFMGKIFDRRLYPMLCTKAAFGVSQKFVLYRKPYADALSVLDKRAPKGTDGTVSGGSMDDFYSGCVLCTPNVTGGPQRDFCYVRTRVYNSNCTLQQAFYPVDNTAYQRCKWSDTWSEWKQFVS